MRIEFHDAGMAFEGRTALSPLTLAFEQTRLGVIGLNGSGKSTFARLAGGLIKPNSGRVLIDGLDSARDAAKVMGLCGFIFQNPANQIILPLVGDDIALGLKARGIKGAAVTAAVEAAAERLGITALLVRRPHELSGGELQLAALAAVLAVQPKLVIFDEPTNQLDLKNRAVVARTIEALPEQAMVISHDLELIAGFERVLVFHQGGLAFDGPAAEAIAHYRMLAA